MRSLGLGEWDGVFGVGVLQDFLLAEGTYLLLLEPFLDLLGVEVVLAGEPDELFSLLDVFAADGADVVEVFGLEFGEAGYLCFGESLGD